MAPLQQWHYGIFEIFTNIVKEVGPNQVQGMGKISKVNKRHYVLSTQYWKKSLILDLFFHS